MRRQSRARLPGARRSGECARRPRRDGSSVVRWERAYHLDQFAPHAHLSLNLFCTMAAQVSVDYDTFLKDRLVGHVTNSFWELALSNASRRMKVP